MIVDFFRRGTGLSSGPINYLLGLWLSVRHAVQKADTAEDDKKKSYTSLSGFTHPQAPVSKAHLLYG